MLLLARKFFYLKLGGSLSIGRRQVFLARLARERSTTTCIVNIRDDDGFVHSDPAQINIKFMRFYEPLYTSREHYSIESLKAFLEIVEFPVCSFHHEAGVDRSSHTPNSQNTRTRWSTG